MSPRDEMPLTDETRLRAAALRPPMSQAMDPQAADLYASSAETLLCDTAVSPAEPSCGATVMSAAPSCDTAAMPAAPSWVAVAAPACVAGTKAVAGVLAQVLQPGTVVTLDGDLGAGKTQFTQGLAAGLGISGSVTSPTFNLMIAYDDGRLPLYHFDLYRLNDEDELEDIGFYETIEDAGVSCVEWASKFPDAMPDDRLEICLEAVGDESRRIQARAWGAAQSVLDAWLDALSADTVTD